VRFKPPLPAIKGLFGQPTVINNVISFASVPLILGRGAGYYRDYGIGRSRGTLPTQLAGNLRCTGLVEKAFGVTLCELLYDYGGGSYSGRPIRAVQVGGPLGAYLPESQFDTPLDYEAFAQIGAMLGHGGIVAFDDTVDLLEQARYAMEFCAVESCGKCTPCRIGSTRGVEVLERIGAGIERAKNLALLDDLCETMRHGSLCALGGLTPDPVRSALEHFVPVQDPQATLLDRIEFFVFIQDVQSAFEMILRAADELHDDHMISEATWQKLKDALSEKQLFDLIFTVGQYTLVSMFLNTVGVQVEK
jgi:formate dehydrogenase iron-sulfur subunit